MCGHGGDLGTPKLAPGGLDADLGAERRYGRWRLEVQGGREKVSKVIVAV
jgi:hypothetical protein